MYKIDLDSKEMTQEKAVLLHLIHKGSITSLQAIRLYGCTRLSARILEYRKMGYDIVTEIKTGKNKYGYTTNYANYILMKNHKESKYNR